MRLPGKSVFSSPKPPAPLELPPIEEPAVIPDPDDKARKAAQRRKFAERRQQSGRLSTINTGSTVLG